MASLIDIIVPKVEAQSTDVIAQPTFGTIDAGLGSTTNSNILLKAQNNITSYKVGDTFKVTVTVNTGSVKISEYKIAVKFDSNKLHVKDEDTNTNGTQVTLLDNVFSVADVANNNIVQDSQVIVDAKAPTGTDAAVNRDVVVIEFQAQSEGTTLVSVNQAVDGARLTKLNGQPINFTTSELNIQISSATGNPQPNPNPNPNPQPNPPPPSPVSTSTGGNNNGGSIPKTGIADGPSYFISIIFGVLLIVVGLSISLGKKKEHK